MKGKKSTLARGVMADTTTAAAASAAASAGESASAPIFREPLVPKDRCSGALSALDDG